MNPILREGELIGEGGLIERGGGLFDLVKTLTGYRFNTHYWYDTVKTGSMNLKIKNLSASNLSFIPPINKNLFSLENEKQVLIFKNDYLVMQSWVRIVFGKVGACHCCADKSINVIKT